MTVLPVPRAWRRARPARSWSSAGYPVSVSITASLRHIVRVSRGDLGWRDALRTASVTTSGPD